MYIEKVLRVLKGVALPYKPTTAEKEFMKHNRRHWRETNSEPATLVETYLDTPTSLLEKFVISKIVEAQKGFGTIVLLNSFRKKSSSAHGLARSFKLNNFVCLWRQYTNLYLVLKCFTQAVCIFKSVRTSDELLDLRLQGIHVGDLLYDTLIRFCPGTYTVKTLIFRKHFRLVFRALVNFYSGQRLFRRYNIRAVVSSHTVYAEFGILCRIAHARGAVVLLKDMDVFRSYRREDNIYEHFLKITVDGLKRAERDHKVVKEANDYFHKRLMGKIDQIDVRNAYGDKRIYERHEFLQLFGADRGKKSVFVLAHAFSDAPHVGGKLAFPDYYIWLRETLRQLSLSNEVNVFVKPHPSSYMWGENGAVEQLVEANGLKNVHITPADLSTASIKEIADYVITARGTAGLEYSGYGIPAIICGEGYYSGFGIAHEQTSASRYLTLLSTISSLPRLDEATSLRARVLLYLTFGRLTRSSIAPGRAIFPGDDMELLREENFAEMTARLLKEESYMDAFYFTVSKAVADAL